MDCGMNSCKQSKLIMYFQPLTNSNARMVEPNTEGELHAVIDLTQKKFSFIVTELRSR